MPDQLTDHILLVHAVATWFMTGLIWFVQIVHYPLMKDVARDTFAAFANAHLRRTTWIVAPTMLAEASAALFLLWSSHAAGTTTPLHWAGLILLVLVWVSTFALQVPMHTKLLLGFDSVVWQRLVTTNWLRTCGWSGRGIIALLLLK